MDTQTQEYNSPLYKYKPSTYKTRFRKAQCPKCKTFTKHPILKVEESGDILDCVWCHSKFPLLGNTRHIP